MVLKILIVISTYQTVKMVEKAGIYILTMLFE
jgi:hypothetical protein